MFNLRDTDRPGLFRAGLFFRVYGLTLAADALIPGLVPLSETPEDVDLRVHFGRWPDGEPDEIVAFDDGTRFGIAANEIWCSWTTTPHDAATYLLGPVLALVLRRRGVLSLHASGVMFGERAALFAATAGGGKSTTAAAFARRGHRILSDDVVPLVVEGPRVAALPAYPRVRLWDEAAAGLFGAADALPLLTPTWSKRFLDVSDRFHDAPADVAAIYLLGAFSDADTIIDELRGHRAAVELIVQTSANEKLTGDARARELDLVAAVVQRVRVCRVHPPRGLERIGELCDAIERDMLASHA